MTQVRIVFFLVCLSPLLSSAQSPYLVDWKKESIYLGLGLSTVISGQILSKKTRVLTIEEILVLDPNSVNKFDRKATSFYSRSATNASDIFLLSSLSLPTVFLINEQSRSDFGKIALLYGEAVLITGGLTLLTKSTAKRSRPFTYNDSVSLVKKQTQQARFSFFSGHTSISSVNYFFTAKIFSDYFPDSKYKPYVWTGAALIPAVTGYLRVRAGKHFYSDVILGYCIGALVGIGVPHLHKHKKDKPLSFHPSPNGFLMTWNFSK